MLALTGPAVNCGGWTVMPSKDRWRPAGLALALRRACDLESGVPLTAAPCGIEWRQLD